MEDRDPRGPCRPLQIADIGDDRLEALDQMAVVLPVLLLEIDKKRGRFVGATESLASFSAPEEILLIGEAGEKLAARLGDQDLVLELDALPAALSRRYSFRH